jgi:hypothetical protein
MVFNSFISKYIFYNNLKQKPMKKAYLTLLALCLMVSLAVAAEPTKSLVNSKISLMAVIDADFHVKISWMSPEGHNVSKFIIQTSRDGETFYDFKEVAVSEKEVGDNEDRLKFQFKDVRLAVGVKYYRIVEIDTENKTYYYAPAKIFIAVAPAPKELVTCLQTSENNIFRIKTNNPDTTVLLTTESGMGIPCDYEYSDITQTGVLKPVYYLEAGNYFIKIRIGETEKKYIIPVKEVEGSSL